MFKFIKEPDELNPYDMVQINMQVHAHADLAQMLDLFEKFLMASGYYLKGKLEIVGEEE